MEGYFRLRFSAGENTSYEAGYTLYTVPENVSNQSVGSNDIYNTISVAYHCYFLREEFLFLEMLGSRFELYVKLDTNQSKNFPAAGILTHIRLVVLRMNRTGRRTIRLIKH